MFASTASGFKDAPVSRFLVQASVLVPIVVSLLEVQYLFELAITPHLLVWNQWWRIALNQLVYVNQSDVIFGSLLLYNLRVIERFFGSYRFLSLVIVVQLLCTLAVPALVYVLHVIPQVGDFVNVVRPGPTPLIFALLWLYYTLVPTVYRFEVAPGSADGMSVQISDKAFLYFVAVQLAVNCVPTSVVSAVVGWTVSGLIYHEIIPAKNWRVPFYARLGLESRP